jgi:mRNA interferase MazF
LSEPPHQAEVVWADPDPTRGSEQAKPRPFIVVSVDPLNRSSLGLSLVVPMTRTDFSNALHLEIKPPEGGLGERSFAMPEQLRAMSHERITRRLGEVRPGTLDELLRRCRVLLQQSA